MKKYSFNSIITKQPPKGVYWGYLEISTLDLSISIVTEAGIGIGIAKSLFLTSELCFENRIFMFFLVPSYGISTTLLQILISLRFPIHSSKGVHWCYTKRRFELSEAFVHCILKKITAPNISAYFAYFLEKTSKARVLFTYTAKRSWDFSIKLFKAAIL